MTDGGKQSNGAAIAGGWATACAVVAFAVVAAARQRRRRDELEKEVHRQMALRNGEHAGRVKAEKELRAFFSSRMVADGGLFFAPIATVYSCFTECVGTPRQGQFAPSTRALLVFDKGSVSPVSLEGVEEFSHLWVFWAFHLNTNQKDARAHAGVREDSRGHTFPAKVSPPFLKRRVGVFSTRTPHRPNPIGVSLCKVEQVNSAQRSISLSGVDLVDGTPVLDVKPYVPDYDRPRTRDTRGAGGKDVDSGVRVAEWVEASVKHRRAVEWAPGVELQLQEACSELRRKGDRARLRFFLGDHEGAKKAITESLSVDVRSIRKTREALKSPSLFLLFDGLRVEFATTAEPSNTGGSAPFNPTVWAATNAAIGGAAPPEGQGSPLASADLTGDPGRHGREDGDSASSTSGGDRVVNGGGGGLASPALVSEVETVRVLSVEVAEGDSSSAY
eukprot:g11298.t1